jgi:hypothetical protein
MHDINYFHEHELKDHDFLGCCKDCQTSLNIIKPHILAFARKIEKFTPRMLGALPPDELYRLYQILDDLAHMDAGAHLASLILEEEEIKTVLPVIRAYYAMFFSIHEKQLAETLIHSQDPWKTLSGFPLYPRYEALIKGQMEAVPGLPEKKFIFIGCGPVPMSLIFMARLYETRCLGLDTSEKSVLAAKKVIGALGLEDLVDIVQGDDTSLENLSWDAVLVAALAEPKKRIFENLQRILSIQNRAIPVIYRTYTGMRAVLYEPVSPSDTKGFRIIKKVFPTGRVNNTTIFAELENE